MHEAPNNRHFRQPILEKCSAKRSKTPAKRSQLSSNVSIVSLGGVSRPHAGQDDDDKLNDELAAQAARALPEGLACSCHGRGSGRRWPANEVVSVRLSECKRFGGQSEGRGVLVLLLMSLLLRARRKDKSVRSLARASQSRWGHLREWAALIPATCGALPSHTASCNETTGGPAFR